MRHAAAIQAASTDLLPAAEQVSVLGGRGGADLCAAGMRCAFAARFFRQYPAPADRPDRDHRCARLGAASAAHACQDRAGAERRHDRRRACRRRLPCRPAIAIGHASPRRRRPGIGGAELFLRFPGSLSAACAEGAARAHSGQAGGRTVDFVSPSGPGNLLRHLALAALDEPDALSAGEENGIERALGELLRSAVTAAGERYRAATVGTGALRSGAGFHPAKSRRRRAQSRFGRGSAWPVAAHAGADFRAPRCDHRAVDMVRRVLPGAKDDLADLRLCERSITEIAFAWGFNDAAHFSRAFSNAFGLSPTRFRAMACRLKR